MNTSETVQLENSRVLLRPLTVDDIQYLEKFVINEPEIWMYSLKRLQTTKDLIDYISEAISGKELGVLYPFIVYDKKKKEYAGCTRFYGIDTIHNTAMLGYTWYGKKFQGTGLNKNAKFLLLEYAFETLQLARVEFRADVNNERSIKAMKSLGCKVEGVLRKNFAIGEIRRDSIVLSILKEEWPKCKTALKEAIQ